MRLYRFSCLVFEPFHLAISKLLCFLRIEARSFICHFHWFHVCDILFVSDLSLRFIDSANSMYSTVCDILPMNRANSDIAIVRSCIFHLGDVMVVLICNALHRFSHRFSCPVIRTTACAARFLRLLTLKTSRRDAPGGRE